MKNYLNIRINNADFISNKCEHLHSRFKNQLCQNRIKEVGFLYILISRNLGVLLYQKFTKNWPYGLAMKKTNIILNYINKTSFTHQSICILPQSEHMCNIIQNFRHCISRVTQLVQKVQMARNLEILSDCVKLSNVL